MSEVGADRRRRGRPNLAPDVSQLPACAVPTPLYDAVAHEALRRDVSIAQVVRDALIYHLKNRAAPQPVVG